MLEIKNLHFLKKGILDLRKNAIAKQWFNVVIKKKNCDTEQNTKIWAIWTSDSVVLLLNQNFTSAKCSYFSYIKSSPFQFFNIVYFTGINKLGSQYTLKIIPQKIRITAVNHKNTSHTKWPLRCCGHSTCGTICLWTSAMPSASNHSRECLKPISSMVC